MIIDGQIGYLGGMNVGERYALGVRGKEWRDSHIRLTGEVCMTCSKPLCRIGLHQPAESPLFRRRLRHYFPSPKEQWTDQNVLPAQIVANGLYNKFIHQDVINLSYFNLIHQAKKRLWIQTPYFSPSEPVLQSLKILALRGVDVRIMTSSYYTFGVCFITI